MVGRFHTAPRTATDKRPRAPVFKSYTENSPQNSTLTHADKYFWSDSEAVQKRVTQCPNMAIRIKCARMNTNMMTSANERRVNDN